MKKKEMTEKLEDLKDSVLNRYGFIYVNRLDGITEKQAKEIEKHIDGRWRLYRDTWIIPKIEFLLRELKGKKEDEK